MNRWTCYQGSMRNLSEYGRYVNIYRFVLLIQLLLNIILAEHYFKQNFLSWHSKSPYSTTNEMDFVVSIPACEALAKTENDPVMPSLILNDGDRLPSLSV